MPQISAAAATVSRFVFRKPRCLRFSCYLFVAYVRRVIVRFRIRYFFFPLRTPGNTPRFFYFIKIIIIITPRRTWAVVADRRKSSPSASKERSNW